MTGWFAFPDGGQARQEIAALIPDAGLRNLSGVGHMMPVEAPDAFLRILRDYLSRPITEETTR